SAGELFADQTEDGDAVLAVNAGEGTVLRVLSIQPAGKRAMGAAEFLRGHAVQPGDRSGAELRSCGECIRAFVFDRHGSPAYVLQVRDVPTPQPGFREVRVRMLGGPMNPSDL